MDKTKLVEALKTVDPARSDKIAVNRGFWFTGKNVVGYNSQFAISVPLQTDFVGGIQETIMPLLDHHSGTVCEIEQGKKDDSVLVKVGPSKFKLSTSAIEDLTFRMPKVDESAQFSVKDVPEFLYALKACTRSLGNDVSENEFKGVTFIARKNTLHMFAFERLSMTHAQVPITGTMGFERVLVPTDIVNQILRLTDGLTEMQMSIDEKQLVLRCPRAKLWGLIEEQERSPRDFLAYSKELRAEINADLISIKGENFRKLPGMVERASVITQSAVEVTKTKITWLDGKCYFRSESSRGIAEEVAKPEKGSAGDCVVNVDSERMKRGLDLDQMGMTDRCVIFVNDDNTLHYFVSGA